MPTLASATVLRATSGIALFALATAAALAMPAFGDWSALADIETLPNSSQEVNSASIDGCASISPDGLTLAFNSFRSLNQQIWIATRANTSDGFGDPVMLPSPINTPAQESCPTITQGHRLYFTRSTGVGGTGDLYVSKLGPNGWSNPVSLGPRINTPENVEEGVSFYEDDEGRQVLVFSRRPNGPFVGLGGKIFQSVDGAPATLVAGGPHSSSSDNRPSVSHDGKEIFWDSLRGGSLGVWYARRSNTSDSFGQAVHLSQFGAGTRPHLRWDGEQLVVAVASDLHFATREKVAGN